MEHSVATYSSQESAMVPVLTLNEDHIFTAHYTTMYYYIFVPQIVSSFKIFDSDFLMIVSQSPLEYMSVHPVLPDVTLVIFGGMQTVALPVRNFFISKYSTRPCSQTLPM
jgi:hypothetical protein